MYDTTKPYNEDIKALVKETWDTPYISIKDNVIRKKLPYRIFYDEYSHTDGVGSKGIYHWQQRSFRNAVLDALAMNLNDLLLMRAVPYAINNHLFLPRDDEAAIIEIISCLSEECKKYYIAIAGGETAIHNDMGGLEISITMLGLVKKFKVNRFKDGDILLGIESNGLHSNGFTKVREVFKDEYKDDFIKETAIYFNTVNALDKLISIHGMCHITGGAFTKLRDYSEDVDFVIGNEHRLNPHGTFLELHERGVPDEEMYKTFNCGIGFVLGVNEKDVDRCLENIKDFKADVIGKIVKGSNRVKIKSKFSRKEILY